MTAKNPGGHSSMPRADNAIYDLARAIQRLEAHTFPVETNEITLTYFARTAPLLNNEVGDAMARLVADPRRRSDRHTQSATTVCGHTRAPPAFPTMLSGRACRERAAPSGQCGGELPYFPGHTPAEISANFRRSLANPDLEWRVVGVPVTSPASPFNNGNHGRDCTHRLNRFIRDYPSCQRWVRAPRTAPTCARLGIPSYSLTGIFINPKDSFAHGLNERVPRAAVGESLLFWRAMIDQLATTLAWRKLKGIE